MTFGETKEKDGAAVKTFLGGHEIKVQAFILTEQMKWEEGTQIRR